MYTRIQASSFSYTAASVLPLFINFLCLLPFSIIDVKNCRIFPMNFSIRMLLAIITYAMVSNS